MKFVAYEALVFICECGDRFVGGRPDDDPGTKQWIKMHDRTQMHAAWVQRRVRETCTHAGKTTIVPVGKTQHWRRCDTCWKYLFLTDAHGKPLLAE